MPLMIKGGSARQREQIQFHKNYQRIDADDNRHAENYCEQKSVRSAVFYSIFKTLKYRLHRDR
jgi:hypothetical protein